MPNNTVQPSEDAAACQWCISRPHRLTVVGISPVASEPTICETIVAGFANHGRQGSGFRPRPTQL